MRFSFILLFLCGCPAEDKPVHNDTGADDTAPPTESDTSADTVSDTPVYSIEWSTVVGNSDVFHDIVPTGDGAYYISSPNAGDRYGAVWSIDDETADLADAPMWTGSAKGQGFGVGVAAFDLPDVGRSIATAEYASSEGYSGRFLAAPDDGIGGVMADLAVIDIQGPVADGPSTGGFFGYGSARWGDDLYISQTNAEPAVYRGPAVAALTFADMEPVDGIDGDPVADGGQGYATLVVRSTGYGLLTCSRGGVCQHISDDGPDWYLAEGVVGDGEIDLDTIDRDTSMDVYVTVVYGYYAISVIGEDIEDCYSVVLDDDGGVILSPPDIYHLSVTAGTTRDGISWTAYGVIGWIDDASDQVGFIDLIAGPRGGDIYDTYITLPLEAPYYCLPRVVSDEVDQIALICQDGDYAMIGTVTVE